MEKDGGIPCVGPTLQHCNPQACGVSGSVTGTIILGGTNNRRRKRSGWAIFGKDDVKNILKEAFCDNIISGSIVTGTCDLQVLDYNTATGVAKVGNIGFSLSSRSVKMRDSSAFSVCIFFEESVFIFQFLNDKMHNYVKQNIIHHSKIEK